MIIKRKIITKNFLNLLTNHTKKRKQKKKKIKKKKKKKNLNTFKNNTTNIKNYIKFDDKIITNQSKKNSKKKR